MECLEGCEFQGFVDKRFHCRYYDEFLPTEVNRDLAPEEGEGEKIIVFRCKECVKEGKIGISKEADLLAGIRNSLVYLGDHFYSFKDEFENDLATLYRNLKKLEEGLKKGE